MLFVASLVTIAAEVSASAQTPASPGQPKLARVSGIVVDAQDGHPLSRGTVCFRRDGDTGYYDQIAEHCDETDQQGQFNLVGLPIARYSYGVERQGILLLIPLPTAYPR